VDVRPIVGDPAEGFMEVFKYAVKFSDQPVADTWHAFQTLKGKRLLGSAGCFRGVEVPEELTDESLSMICRMSSCSIAICMERATPFRMRIAPKRRSLRGSDGWGLALNAPHPRLTKPTTQELKWLE
jgi:hypothetical protein